MRITVIVKIHRYYLYSLLEGAHPSLPSTSSDKVSECTREGACIMRLTLCFSSISAFWDVARIATMYIHMYIRDPVAER